MTHATVRRIHPFFQTLAALLMVSWLVGCGPGDPIGAPTITTQPTGATVAPGASVTLTVVATGTGTLSYQWQQNGVNIPGATASSILLTSVPITATGNYTVVISNAQGSVTSQAAVVTVTVVNVAPTISVQPVSTSVQVGTNVSLSVVASGSGSLSYQWYQNNVAIAGATSSLLTLPSVTTANAGNYTVVVGNASGAVTSQAAVLTVTDPAAPNVAPTIAAQPTSILANLGAAAIFKVAATGSGTLGYRWFKDGVALSDTTSGSTGVFGTSTSSLTLTGITAASAGSYTVSVANSVGSVTTAPATLSLTTAIVGPTITQQPVGVTAPTGGDAPFGVSATGSGTLSYQWLKDGTPVAGALAPTLILHLVTSTSAGLYSVVITDGVGSTSSTPVSLVVTP